MFPNREWVLIFVLLIEWGVFSYLGTNFASVSNLFEIVRLSVELGLVALALTPVIVTAGIDLSVGSMMGLAAVTLGYLWRDLHWPMLAAVSGALIIGGAGGALNAFLIARLKMPPLIVTLGTFSLFRGAAEGLTRGIENYSGFPQGFLYFAQAYLFGWVPVQLVFLLAGIVGAWWWLQRSRYGRSLYAIGLSPSGARYSGVPVTSRLASTYIVSGLAAGAAAVIYVAHLGQAKSDAGTGFELMAITAVVLGGTSIFGGRGTIVGTVLGLSAVVVLQNGLRLSNQPAELAGILTGVLLVGTIAIDRLARGRGHLAGQRTTGNTNAETGEIDVKNSQVAVLSVVILLAAGIVAGSNWMLVRSVKKTLPADGGAPATGNKRLAIAMMPKAKGDPYFISCRQGAEEAAKEANVDLLWDGPTEDDAAKQNEVVEAWITRGVDCIAVSVENQVGISTVLRKARQKGIKVVTWDADAEKDARDYFVNQATPQGIGYSLTDEAARITGGKGEFAIITASLTAANQNEWIKHIKERLQSKYPELKLVAIQPSDGDRDRAFRETQNVLKVHPNVKLVMGVAAPAVPGAAEAVKQSGRTDVKVIGLSLPSLCRSYIKEGVIESIVLWNTGDLGYLTVLASKAVASGEVHQGTSDFTAGRLGKVAIDGSEVRLGAPFIFNKSNIDKFNF